jgi:hypothetical protein
MIAALMSATGCTQSTPCTERTSDGPWEHVGSAIPSEQIIAGTFSSEGTKGLVALLGKPFQDSPEEISWVFENRSSTKQVWCNPRLERIKYDQVFTVVRVRREGVQDLCEVEAIEFIESKPLRVEEALSRERTPLGFKPRPCGAAQ